MSAISLTEFARRLNRIMPMVAKEFMKRQENELYRGKITLPQFIILEFLNLKGGCKMSDIARYIDVTTAAVTGMVDRLVKSGYVQREVSAADRRIIKINLTAKGKNLVERVNKERIQLIINIFGRISQREREEYLNILTHIHDILTQPKRV